MYLDTNIKHIAQHNIKFSSYDIQESTNITIKRSKNGLYTLLVNQKAIHSLYDPLREAKQEIRHIPNTCDVVILAGLGLGYLALEIVRQYPKIGIIIIEPDNNLLLAAQHGLNLTPLYKHRKLAIFDQSATITDFINQLSRWSSVSPYWHEFRARVQLDPILFRAYEKQYKIYTQRIQTNILTAQQQGLLWWRNSIKNLTYWPKVKPVSVLFNSLNHCPVLIIGAGASLTRYIHLLPLLKERMAIICVDTALRILLSHNIYPDFTISIDGQYWNTRHLDRINVHNIRYVADSAVHPLLLRKINSDNLYFMSPLVPFMQSVEDLLVPFGYLRSGGSVSITAWDLALKLGAESIWLLGCDFSYPNRSTHAKGAFFEERILSSSHRLESLFSLQFNQKHEQRIFIPNNNQVSVESDARMLLYIRWLEEAIAQTHIPTYNLSDIGAKINGIPYLKSTQALELPIKRQQIENSLQKTSNAVMESTNLYKNKLVLSWREMTLILKKFYFILKKTEYKKVVNLKEDLACKIFNPILFYWLEALTNIENPNEQILAKKQLENRLEYLISNASHVFSQ